MLRKAGEMLLAVLLVMSAACSQASRDSVDRATEGPVASVTGETDVPDVTTDGTTQPSIQDPATDSNDDVTTDATTTSTTSASAAATSPPGPSTDQMSGLAPIGALGQPTILVPGPPTEDRADQLVPEWCRAYALFRAQGALGMGLDAPPLTSVEAIVATLDQAVGNLKIVETGSTGSTRAASGLIVSEFERLRPQLSTAPTPQRATEIASQASMKLGAQVLLLGTAVGSTCGNH